MLQKGHRAHSLCSLSCRSLLLPMSLSKGEEGALAPSEDEVLVPAKPRVGQRPPLPKYGKTQMPKREYTKHYCLSPLRFPLLPWLIFLDARCSA